MTNQATPVVGTIYYAFLCPLPLFFCLLKPIAKVYTPRSLGFPSRALSPLAYVYLTVCLTLSPKGYIPLYRLPLKTMSKECCFYCQCCFYVSQSRIVHNDAKRLQNLMPISNSEQWTAGNSGLPVLSGCQGSSLYWYPFFSYCNLPINSRED
jgi:hypothetical protein